MRTHYIINNCVRPADDRFPSLKRISLFSAVAHLCMFVYVWEGERVAAYGSTIVEKTYTENKCLSSLSADELYRINVQLKFRNGKKMKYERKWMRVKERGALLYREKKPKCTNYEGKPWENEWKIRNVNNLQSTHRRSGKAFAKS